MPFNKTHVKATVLTLVVLAAASRFAPGVKKAIFNEA